MVLLNIYIYDEAANFNIVINNNFKSFKYKAKLFENTKTDGSNRILRNKKVAVSLKRAIRRSLKCN